MSKVKIRIADPDRDSTSMLAIYRYFVANSIATFDEVAPSEDEFAFKIRSILPTYPWLVAEIDDQVIGYAYASQHHPRVGYRWTAEVSVYVSESATGMGIGTILYDSLLNILAHQGLKTLLAIISVPNPASEALHKKLGFEKVGHFEGIGFKFGQWQQTGWWQKQIGDLDASPKEPIPFSKLCESGTVPF